jgi:hypothetical protein
MLRGVVPFVACGGGAMIAVMSHNFSVDLRGSPSRDPRRLRKTGFRGRVTIAVGTTFLLTLGVGGLTSSTTNADRAPVIRGGCASWASSVERVRGMAPRRVRC